MPKTKENLNKNILKLSIKQNTLVIISSIVVLAIIAQVIFIFPYILISPLLLVVAFFCALPLIKSNTRYSRPYIRAQVYLAIMAVVALMYFAVQLVKDQTGISCTGLMGSRASCVDSMWLSAWGVTLFASIPAAILCAYGAFTQLRLPK